MLQQVLNVATPCAIAAAGFFASRAVGNWVKEQKMVPDKFMKFATLIGNGAAVAAFWFGGKQLGLARPHADALLLGAGVALIEGIAAQFAPVLLMGKFTPPAPLGMGLTIFEEALLPEGLKDAARAAEGQARDLASRALIAGAGAADATERQLMEMAQTAGGQGEYIQSPLGEYIQSPLGEYVQTPLGGVEIEEALAGVEIEEALASDNDVITSRGTFGRKSGDMEAGVVSDGIYGEDSEYILDEGVVEDGIYGSNSDLGIEVEEAMADWHFEGKVYADGTPQVTRKNVVVATKRAIEAQKANNMTPNVAQTQALVNKTFGVGTKIAEPQGLRGAVSAITKVSAGGGGAYQYGEPIAKRLAAPKIKPWGRDPESGGIFSSKTLV
jgi:hypothetical protein